MKILDYKIRENAPVSAPAAANAPMDMSGSATRADVDALAGQINSLRAEIDGMATKRATAKKEAQRDE